MKFKSVVVTGRGGLEVLQVVENDLLESRQVTGNVVLLSPELLGSADNRT